MNDYPANWLEIANKAKSDAGWKCVRCNHDHDPETGFCLTVHHLDMDKANSRWWNLAPLCQRCHLRIQARVKMHQVYIFEHSTWFKPYAAGYYAWKYQQRDLSRNEVMAELEALLALERIA